jgi:hypothetical protein
LGRRAAILLQQERDRNEKVKEVIEKEQEKHTEEEEWDEY